MSFTFYNLLTNDDLQNIILNRIPYNVNKIFEPFEVLYKLINKDNLLGCQDDQIWTKSLKDNQQAIDCIDVSTSPKTLIQIKHTKHVNETQIIGYMKEYVQRNLQQYNDNGYQYKLITYTDELYDTLLLKFKQQYLSSKISTHLKPYQQTFIDKHIAGILSHKISVINCFCRFGKSYLMKYLQEILHWEVLVITTKPTETGEQFQQLGLPYKSIQYLKFNPDYKIQQQYIFIDEAQEQFMTELTETLIDLSRFKKVLFFTGTSETLLEYIYSYEPYYCHFNFGDLLQKLSAKDGIDNETKDVIKDSIQNEIRFPQISFKYVPSDTDIQYDTSDDYIHLVFNRNLNIRSATKLAKEKNYILQTSQTQSNIQDENAHGVYLCIEQYTTGITLLKCVSVEIQHSSFTETDIQSIFRCWNSTLLDVPRVVYFRDIQLMQNCVEYIYRQTGQQYITTNIIKKVFSNLVSEEDLNRMTFKQLEINISSHILKQLKNKILHLDTQTKHTLDDAIKSLDQTIQKEFQKENQCPENQQLKNQPLENQPLTENQQLVKDSIQQIVNEGTINDSFLVLLQRIICQLTFDTINYDVQDNEVNRDYLTVPLFQKLVETERQKVLSLKTLLDQFNSQRELSNFETAVGQLQLIFFTYDRAVNSRIVKYIRQLVSQSNPIQRYTLLKEYFKTTKTEQKRNAEILTPDYIVDEMIQKLISLYGLEQIKKWQIIEPCCGKGAFLIGLYKVGVPIENLHWNDFNQANVSFCNLLFNQDKGTCQDALEIDYSKYDLVITNPPYNTERGKDNVQHQIYQNFALKFLESKHSSLLIKSNWCLDQRKLFRDFRNQFMPHCRVIVSFNDQECNKMFNQNGVQNKVDIKGGVLYYIAENVKSDIQNTNTKANTYLMNDQLHTYNMNDQVFIQGQVQKVQQSILDQFQYLSQAHFLKLSYQDQMQLTPFEESVPVLQSLKQDQQFKFISKKLLTNQPFTDKFILATPSAATGAKQGLIRYVILEPGKVFNKSYIGFVCNTYDEAKKLGDYLLSDDVQTIIKSVKQTQSVSKQIFEHIPSMINVQNKIIQNVQTQNNITQNVQTQNNITQNVQTQNNITQNTYTYIMNDQLCTYNTNDQVFIQGQVKKVQSSILDQFQYLSKGHFLKLSYQDQMSLTPFEESVPVLQSLKQNQQFKFISKSLLTTQPFTDKFIVATPSAATGANQGLIRYVILEPGKVFNNSYIGFVCNTYDEAKKLGDYLLSDDVQEIIKRVKQTQSVSKQIFEHIPSMEI